ncbi:hypothetical protein Hanom_Chr15g01404911 [Helianthus anomalus]
MNTEVTYLTAKKMIKTTSSITGILKRSRVSACVHIPQTSSTTFSLYPL